MNRSRDWMQQAKFDLEHARKSITLGDYDGRALLRIRRRRRRQKRCTRFTAQSPGGIR
ncbi:MAG: hypothetical protein ACUVR7_02285 [Armatimonadota bacterium]